MEGEIIIQRESIVNNYRKFRSEREEDIWNQFWDLIIKNKMTPSEVKAMLTLINQNIDNITSGVWESVHF